jgi:thymidylate synthase
MIKESLGVQFRIKDARNRLPYVEARKFSMSYLVAETIWYMSGNNSTEWISRYAPFWRNITDDGSTANSAYGARIFKPHERASEKIVQWDYVKEELRRDPDSRRAVIHIRSAHDSLHESKDVPCTLSLQFFIRGNALHLHVSMRSSDIILGLAYDVPAFTIMQEVMANELGVELGEYVHTSNSLHCYQRDFEMLDAIANSEVTYIEPMRRLSGLFPTREMVMMEGAVSTATNGQLLTGELFVSPPFTKDLDSSNLDLVHDWFRVLLSRRLRKLHENEMAEFALTHTNDRCYKFFNR